MQLWSYKAKQITAQHWGTLFIPPVHSGNKMCLLVCTLIIRVFQKAVIIKVVVVSK